MTDLIVQMLFSFFNAISDLFFNTNFKFPRSGGFIMFISVVFGISIFVYIVRRLVGVSRNG